VPQVWDLSRELLWQAFKDNLHGFIYPGSIVYLLPVVYIYLTILPSPTSGSNEKKKKPQLFVAPSQLECGR
jgi:hypothetical protein